MDLERLNQIGTATDPRLRGRKGDEKRTGKARKASFSRVLDQASLDEAARLGIGPLPELDGSETIEQLLDDVHKAGEALKRDPYLAPLDQYRNSVRLFLRYVLDKGFTVEEELGIRNPRSLEQKKYVVVKSVDRRLESLAAYVLKGQAEQLEILRRLDEINGLLVDLAG
jgi:uncharacterized protein YaaR (DUF327 family)